MNTKSNGEKVNYSNDVFFKYSFGSEDEDSAYLRNSVIEYLTGIHIVSSQVLNPNLDPKIVMKKKMVLDIRVKDSNGISYDIEMQTAYKGLSEKKRFELYGARMLSNQLKELTI